MTASEGTISSAGTFTPATAAAPAPSPRLNPFVDASPWGKVDIGGVDIGLVLSIDGAEKPETWDFQKGTGSSGATSVWKGSGLAESITIVVAAYDKASFDNLYTIRDVLRPHAGRKPPSLSITNAAINFNGIARIASANIGQPKWVAAGAYWTLEIKVSEYSPSKTTNTGQAGAAKVGSQFSGGAPETANERAAKELAKAVSGIF